jgi:hypothetical protein
MKILVLFWNTFLTILFLSNILLITAYISMFQKFADLPESWILAIGIVILAGVRTHQIWQGKNSWSFGFQNFIWLWLFCTAQKCYSR